MGSMPQLAYHDRSYGGCEVRSIEVCIDTIFPKWDLELLREIRRGREQDEYCRLLFICRIIEQVAHELIGWGGINNEDAAWEAVHALVD